MRSRTLARQRAALVFCCLGLATAAHTAGAATKPIYSFPNVPPQSRLAADRAGNLYGVVPYGGAGCKPLGCGYVFRLTPPPTRDGVWSSGVLFRFTGASGVHPVGTPVLDAAGNIYGTAQRGGFINGKSSGEGTVWKLAPPDTGGGSWTLTVLYAFSHPTSGVGGPDGGQPVAGLIRDGVGVLYGTTKNGGAHDAGVAFSLSPPPAGGSQWTETVLHSFGARDDVFQPTGPMTLFDHSLLGVGDEAVARHNERGSGVIYRLRRMAATEWKYSVLYRFPIGSGEYASPYGAGFADGAGLFAGRSGNLFGATGNGGPDGFGTIFALSPPAPGQTAWTVQTLHTLLADEGAGPPDAPIEVGSLPALYGSTEGFGPGSKGGQGRAAGTTFRLDPPASGSGPWTFTLLHAFSTGHGDSAGCYNPSTRLTATAQRQLFGVAAYGGADGHGAVFEQPRQ